MSDGKTTSLGGVRDFQSLSFPCSFGPKICAPTLGNSGSATTPVVTDSIYSLKNPLLHDVVNPPGDFNTVSL